MTLHLYPTPLCLASREEKLLAGCQLIKKGVKDIVVKSHKKAEKKYNKNLKMLTILEVGKH
jgi:hypothetical protein